ncbi:protein amalgam [Fopius arisanus]|uniref:Lac_5 protein n=1 Tax=Fopius arisanus TaxID=64838 RepID=A0A0C9RFT1_9HYME|nr:PREDICTED: protein amalgam-like [Fopius arisanus]
MVDHDRILWGLLIALLIYPNDNFGGASPPEFKAPITNLTIALGRDAIFTCLVEHLGGYRVGWVKADTKAIQAIHEHVITHNPRVSVSHSDHSTWNLHIKGIQLEDAGLYMCQINTDPMKSQTGMLFIEVPPDFIPEQTSGDVSIREGGQVKLTCRATGVPLPQINWHREDGQDIVIRDPTFPPSDQKLKAKAVTKHHGEELRLTKVSRNDMGAYMCIASNGVPPAISKRITINVHFPPVIHVPNQLVAAPRGTDVALECQVEASPKSINYWVKDSGDMIISSSKYEAQTISLSTFKTRMILTIHDLQDHDFGTYTCTAKNSLGEVDFSIRLYKMSGTSRQKSDYDDEIDDIEQVVYGSADDDKMENKVEGKTFASDNTVQGHVGLPSSSASSPPPTMKITRRRPTPMTGSPHGNRSSGVSHQLFHCPISLMIIALCVMIEHFKPF